MFVTCDCRVDGINFDYSIHKNFSSNLQPQHLDFTNEKIEEELSKVRKSIKH